MNHVNSCEIHSLFSNANITKQFYCFNVKAQTEVPRDGTTVYGTIITRICTPLHAAAICRPNAKNSLHSALLTASGS